MAHSSAPSARRKLSADPDAAGRRVRQNRIMTNASRPEKAIDATASPAVTALVASATARQPQRLVMTDSDTLDGAQASGRWLSTDTPVEVKR